MPFLGVLKTYKLTYESAKVMHAVFDKKLAISRWTVASALLKEVSEHFGPKTELLDIYSNNGRCVFTSYTDQIRNGKGDEDDISILDLMCASENTDSLIEVSKQNLQTTVAVDTLEFEDFSVEGNVHIAFSVKDFRAIGIHADSLDARVSAFYSRPKQPLQLAYDGEGVKCEFTLMTIGESRGDVGTPAASIARQASSLSPMEVIPAEVTQGTATDAAPAAPAAVQIPTRNNRQTSTTRHQRRPLPPPANGKLDDHSLFLPDDDDYRWDNHSSEEEDEDSLRWDASGLVSGSIKPASQG